MPRAKNPDKTRRTLNVSVTPEVYRLSRVLRAELDLSLDQLVASALQLYQAFGTNRAALYRAYEEGTPPEFYLTPKEAPPKPAPVDNEGIPDAAKAVLSSDEVDEALADLGIAGDGTIAPNPFA
jgi:hypothetical protein